VTTRLLTSDAAAGATPDAVVVGIVQGAHGPELAPGAEPVDEALGGTLLAAAAALGATGKAEQTIKIATGPLARGAGAAGPGALPPVILAVGLGRAEAADPLPGQDPRFSLETLRRAAGAAVRALVWHPAKAVRENDREPGANVCRVTLALPARDEAEAEAVALGGLLGGYSFTRYRPAAAPPSALTVLARDDVTGAGPRAEALADAVSLARDLVNTAPSDLVPAALAGEAERVAAGAGLSAEVLDEKALSENGYGGILGVGQGSVHPPRLARLEYTPAQADGTVQTVVFIGKGITFDSGGLSLKPPKSMETMKSDMGGAAAIIGAMQAIAALRPNVRVIGYLPLAENMPGGSAQRPSDVLTIYGGKTVEVLNTDAEGRLVLADALARSAADHPDVLVDVATLTGAQLVALGPRIAAVMSNDDELRDAVVAAAAQAGEAMWPMPLPAELRKGLDSAVADLANVAPDRFGGMLIAGLFLREFVPDGVRWAHLDIAGPAFNESGPHGYTPKGGTGAATRTLVQIALDVAEGRL
jgi:leucyl aminopeptidase